jgi:hypothetical protein
MPELKEWDTFYNIAGTASGALIGLQFIVMTLIANNPSRRSVEAGASAFATPNIVHFGAVLILSAVIGVPWNAVSPIAIIFGLMGLSGIIYILIVARRMRTQSEYKPVFEDWLFHIILTMSAYVLLLFSAFGAFYYLRETMFCVGAAALLLLLIGIHNAWDSTTYHILVSRKKSQDKQDEDY